MKKRVIYIIAIIAVSVSANAQTVTYNHDASKMNQFTVAEIGSGSLTPELYYSLLHNNYQKTASAKNKLGFRTTASLAGYMQVDDATDLDSAMIKRAEVEALNVADRQIDIAWAAEKEKINSKMSDFKTNIDRILRFGGTPSQQTLWKEHYNVLTTAIQATQDAYMPNSQRKKQYLSIYADVTKKNETLVKYLVQLSNSKSTSALLNATYTKDNKTAAIVSEAYSRWKQAGMKAINKGNTGGNGGLIIGPIVGPIRPWNPDIIVIDSLKFTVTDKLMTIK